eukprot:Gb_19390 [translate_table: standard]
MTDRERSQIAFPCAACKMQRRKCSENCAFAPYFPSDNPNKFAVVHRVFGASNVLKLLEDLPREQRGEAVNSMVYEATARLSDPVYGCAGFICRLQQQLSDLQSQVATAQANLLPIFSDDQHTSYPTHTPLHHEYGIDEKYRDLGNAGMLSCLDAGAFPVNNHEEKNSFPQPL